MTICQHDPMFTHDGRCSKCYPRKHIVMVRHFDGTIETDDAPREGYIVNQAAQLWGWMGDDEITTGQIAELEARTAETANETEDSR